MWVQHFMLGYRKLICLFTLNYSLHPIKSEKLYIPVSSRAQPHRALDGSAICYVFCSFTVKKKKNILKHTDCSQ